MHTYYPDRYAVLNQNSRKSLLELAIATKYPAPLSFKAEDYDNFVSDLIYLKERCGLESLGQADHFLNYIYWKVLKAKPK
jgi:hypothetical protein